MTLCGDHMSELTKTTLDLPEGDCRRLKVLAQRQGGPAAELVREAVAEYARRKGRGRLPRSLGLGKK